VIQDPEQDIEGAIHLCDLVLLNHSLERALAPLELLKHVQARLASAGRVVVITANTSSLEFAVFGNRHWSGYNFPRHRNLFAANSLRVLARTAGLEVESIATSSSPGAWVRSLRNLLVDWRMPAPLLRALPAARPACAALEVLSRLRGRAAVLVAVLRHPSQVAARG
jgi:hypothetical protein